MPHTSSTAQVSEAAKPHDVLSETSTTPPSVLTQNELSQRDMQRICELLARFSHYTQQFEQEEGMPHDNTKETEALGTVQERISDTRTPNRRTRRTLPKTVNEKTERKEPPIV